MVKSTSFEGSNLPSEAFSHVQASGGAVSRLRNLGQRIGASGDKSHSPAARMPQAHRAPPGFEFSAEARSQVHSPAGRARHEQRGPSTAFSVDALEQLQCRADCLPQEHLACWAMVIPSARAFRGREVHDAHRTHRPGRSCRSKWSA